MLLLIVFKLLPILPVQFNYKKLKLNFKKKLTGIFLTIGPPESPWHVSRPKNRRYLTFGGWRRGPKISRMPARCTSDRSARPPSLS